MLTCSYTHTLFLACYYVQTMDTAIVSRCIDFLTQITHQRETKLELKERRLKTWIGALQRELAQALQVIS